MDRKKTTPLVPTPKQSAIAGSLSTHYLTSMPAQQFRSFLIAYDGVGGDVANDCCNIAVSDARARIVKVSLCVLQLFQPSSKTTDTVQHEDTGYPFCSNACMLTACSIKPKRRAWLFGGGEIRAQTVCTDRYDRGVQCGDSY